MTLALFRLPPSLLWHSSTSILKAFSSSLALDGEDTPAMKALRDIPYPSASPDTSIFEPWSNEYDGVRLPRAVRKHKSVRSSRSAELGHNPADVLEQLAWSEKFAAAEEIRQDLVGMNVPIRPSNAYYRAAWDVLRRRPWPPNRTRMFANWLSLIPNTAQINKGMHFNELKSALLFNSNHLDLESVAQFGTILSSKGYIRIVGATVVACLTRYAHPDVSSRVLDEMIAADDNYKRNKLGLTGEASTRYTDTSKRLWSIAVRTHCTAGRPEVALQMAKRAHEHGFHLTQYTYQYLLGKLEVDDLHEFAAEVRAFPGCGSLDVAKSRLVVEGASESTSIRLVSPNQSRASNESLILAILKRASQSGLPAYAADIVPYFDLYKTDFRGAKAVNRLRSRAYRLSLTAVSAVLLAELLHHHRRGQFKRVLWVFEKFFHVVGVPSEAVKRRLWKRQHYPPHMHLHYWSLPSRITKTTFNLPSRLWPTAHHTALVWSALVHLCKSETELFALYDLLLQYSAEFQKSTVACHHHHHHCHCHCHRHDHDPSSLGCSRSSSASLIAPVDRYDAAHFRPFFIAFTLLRDTKYGLRVLDDMQDRGVAPSAQILSTAAALQARHGEPVLALRMLDVMRGLLEREEQEDKMRQQQALLLSSFTGVLRGLVDRRDLVQAGRVAEMLREQLGYVEGSGGDDGTGGNARTDAVLRFLRRLEEGLGAELEPFTDDWQQQYFYPFLKKRDPEVIKTLNAAPVEN